MLVELLRRQEQSTPLDADDLSHLTPFGVAQRYDDAAGEDEVTLDRDWVTGVVKRTLAWAAS